MNNNRRITFCIALLNITVPIGCDQRFATVDEYDEFLKSEKSPLNKTVEHNDYKMNCVFMLPELFVLREYSGWKQQGFTHEKMRVYADSLSKRYSQSLCFALKIQSQSDDDPVLSTFFKNIQGMANAGYWDYSNTLNKFQFDFRKFVHLQIEGKETIMPAAYDFQRAYGIVPSIQFFFMFPIKPDNEHAFWTKQPTVIKLVVKEFGLGTGTQYFEWKLPLRLSKRPQELASLLGKEANFVR